MSENTNIEREALLNLIDAYAKARAMHALEDLYGTSQSYTAELLGKQNAARAKVVASLSLPAAGQEPVAYRYKDARGHWRYVGAPLTKGWDFPQSLNHEPLYAAPQPAVAAGWMPIETAPKDGTPIIGYCVHSDDTYYEEAGNRLTNYGARAEGLSHVEDGAHVLVWDDVYECSDGWEMPSVTIPAWWTLAHDAEVTANPTHWMPLPPAPSTEGESNANS